jgi:hypothetical protein
LFGESKKENILKIREAKRQSNQTSNGSHARHSLVKTTRRTKCKGGGVITFDQYVATPTQSVAFESNLNPIYSLYQQHQSTTMTDLCEENVPTFPQRIMALLEDEGMQQCMHWLPSGRAFRIFDPVRFEEIVLKAHFNSIKMESFVIRLGSECVLLIDV